MESGSAAAVHEVSSGTLRPAAADVDAEELDVGDVGDVGGSGDQAGGARAMSPTEPGSSSAAVAAGKCQWKPQTEASTVKFQWRVRNYTEKRQSHSKEAEYSDVFSDDRHNKWRLIVYVNGDNAVKNDDFVSIYLGVACAEELPFGWSKDVEFTLRVRHPTDEHLDAKRDESKKFKGTSRSPDWGWHAFIEHAIVREDGFLHLDDSLTIECVATVKTSCSSIAKTDACAFLQYAVEQGTCACLASALDQHCEAELPHVIDDIALETALHKACARRKGFAERREMLRLLLERGAKAVIDSENTHGETALLIAATNGYADAIAELLRHGANTEIRTNGWSPLNIAAHHGHVAAVRALLEGGAPLCEPNSAVCALLMAAKKGHDQVALLLLEHGADPEVQTERGDTALYLLVKRDDERYQRAAWRMVHEYHASVDKCSLSRKNVETARLRIKIEQRRQQRLARSSKGSGGGGGRGGAALNASGGETQAKQADADAAAEQAKQAELELLAGLEAEEAAEQQQSSKKKKAKKKKAAAKKKKAAAKKQEEAEAAEAAAIAEAEERERKEREQQQRTAAAIAEAEERQRADEEAYRMQLELQREQEKAEIAAAVAAAKAAEEQEKAEAARRREQEQKEQREKQALEQKQQQQQQQQQRAAKHDQGAHAEQANAGRKAARQARGQAHDGTGDAPLPEPELEPQQPDPFAAALLGERPMQIMHSPMAASPASRDAVGATVHSPGDAVHTPEPINRNSADRWGGDDRGGAAGAAVAGGGGVVPSSGRVLFGQAFGIGGGSPQGTAGEDDARSNLSAACSPQRSPQKPQGATGPPTFDDTLRARAARVVDEPPQIAICRDLHLSQLCDAILSAAALGGGVADGSGPGASGTGYGGGGGGGNASFPVTLSYTAKPPLPPLKPSSVLGPDSGMGGASGRHLGRGGDRRRRGFAFLSRQLIADVLVHYHCRWLSPAPQGVGGAADPLLPHPSAGSGACGRWLRPVVLQQLMATVAWTPLATAEEAELEEAADFFLERCAAAATELAAFSNRECNMMGGRWTDHTVGMRASKRSAKDVTISCDSKAFGRVGVTLPRTTFDRLVQQHNRIDVSDPAHTRVLSRIFNMIARHRAHTMLAAAWGPTDAELPAPLLSAMAREFGAQHELFTDPLRCSPRFGAFCSLFPDVDVWFGSLGPLFDFWPLRGSFVINLPAFDQVMVNATFRHVVAVLERAPPNNPLSFIVATPWCQLVERFDPTLTVAGCHQWLRRRAVVEVPQASTRESIVNILQNDAGFRVWPPHDKKIAALQRAQLAAGAR